MTQPTALPATALRMVPRPNQQDAITAGTRQLRPRGSRALITSACGTGKTLTAIRIAENLGAQLILNVSPTLDLLVQTALAWRADHRWEPMVTLSSAAVSCEQWRPGRYGRFGRGGAGPRPRRSLAARPG